MLPLHPSCNLIHNLSTDLQHNGAYNICIRTGLCKKLDSTSMYYLHAAIDIRGLGMDT